MSLDPVLTEIVVSRLREVAATMEYALYHSGYSPILRESKDGTAGIADAQGRVIMISGGLQYHSLPYQKAIRSILERFPGERLKPGQSFILNDPYRSGNPHVPDIIAVTPSFHQGRLVAFGVSMAHKADLGGLVPGSSGAAAREIYHDGLLLPPVVFQTDEGVNETVEDVIRTNSRVPDVVLGDLRAQVGCTRLGAARLAALCDEYGPETVVAAMDARRTLTTERLRAEIAAWPDGTASEEGFLDHDGANRDQPVRIAVTATKRGGELILDYSASSPQTQGPVNITATTAQSIALLAVLASADPTIPVNSGAAEAVTFVLPEGLVVSPRHPATVNHYFPTGHLLYNCTLSALGKLNPRRAVAPSGLGQGAVAIGFPASRGGKRAVHYELMITALGGTATHDGTTLVQAMNHLTPGAPVEIIETEYPVRVRRFDIWRDSAGPGAQRGGLGHAREYELLADCVFTARTSNHRFGAWGLHGGEGPAVSTTTINPGTDREERLGPLETRNLKAGDVVRFERSGGAGYGEPATRDPELVARDVRDGYVSLEAAERHYRVRLDPQTLVVDQAATEALRKA